MVRSSGSPPKVFKTQNKKLNLKVGPRKPRLLHVDWLGVHTFRFAPGQPRALARGNLISRVSHAWSRMACSS